MPSLKDCIETVGLSKGDESVIRRIAKKYLADGFNAIDANERAIKDLIKQSRESRKSIVKSIRDVIGFPEGDVDYTGLKKKEEAIASQETTAEPVKEGPTTEEEIYRQQLITDLERKIKVSYPDVEPQIPIAEIVNNHFLNKEPAKPDELTIALTGGLPGAGKSSSIDKEHRAVVINSDPIKKLLNAPDTIEGMNERHEVSSLIAEAVLDAATNGGYHILYDSQLKKFAKADKLIKYAVSKNGSATIYFTDVDPVTSQARAIVRKQRAIAGKTENEIRDVPIHVTVEAYNYSLPTLLALLEKYTENPNVNFEIIGNNVDFMDPIRIFSQVDGVATIHNQEAFDNLLNVKYIKNGDRYERVEKLTKIDLLKRSPEIDARVNNLLHPERTAGLGQPGGGPPEGAENLGEVAGEQQGNRPPAPAPGTGAIANAGNLETPSDRTLEEVPSGNVPQPETSGETRPTGATGRGPNERGNVGVNEPRLPGTRSVGSGEGKVPVSTGGKAGEGTGLTTPDGTPRVSQDIQRGDASGDIRPTRVGNYRITAEDRLGQGTISEKFSDNLNAIRVLRKLETEQRHATKDEQAILARYVGWGGMKAVFPRGDGSFPKGWEARHQELQSLLTPEEYETARRSVLDAHYTSEAVIRGMYDILDRFGFNGGTVLESSMGIGNFFGLIPGGMLKNSNLTGVELDRITGAIAKQLYPNANIHAPQGFQDVDLADDFFDISIGNPPFGNQPIPYGLSKHLAGFSIHNFFFAREVDKLRPGGILINVVTKSFLDKPGERERNYVGQRVKFIGAIRLPNTAFKENANTEVTTDIVILQKLPKEEWGTADKTWLQTGQIPDPLGGEAITLNKYFVDNPEMMLGRMERSGTMYTQAEPTLAPIQGADFEKSFKDAIARLPQDIFVPSSTVTPTADMVKSADAPKETSQYDINQYFVSEDGNKVYQRLYAPDGSLRAREITPELSFSEKQEWGAKRIERLKGMIGVRDAVRRQLELEGSDASPKAIEQSRKEINRIYDAFVARHGYLNSYANYSIIADDTDAPLLLSLEDDYDVGVSAQRSKTLKVPKREPSAKKAAIFKERVRSPYVEATKADTGLDALIISLTERGRIDIPHMMKLTGKTEQELITELHDQPEKPAIFFDPELKQWFTPEEYLSGNVKLKAQQAQRAGLQKNAKALTEAFPPDLKAGDIRVKLGAPYINPIDYEQFAKELLGAQEAVIRFLPTTGGYGVNIRGALDTKDTAEFGTPRMPASKLMRLILNNKEIIVRDRDSDGKTFVNVEETMAAKEKVDALIDAFENWIFKDDERRQRIVKYYNDNVNVNREPKYDGSHLKLPGLNQAVTLFDHVRNAIWRIVRTRQVLLDHVVGAGKTAEMTGGAMELKRLGFIKKPMVVVPNHLIEQWSAEFLKFYPGAKILAMTKNDFQLKNRRKMMARMAVGNYDAIIVAHSSFGFIGVEREREAEFMRKQIEDIQKTIDILKEEVGDDARRVASVERSKERMSAKLKALLDKPKDTMMTFEELGVDQLFIDEAHEFKNLFFTSSRRMLGLGNPNGSKKAMDLYLKTQYLMEKNNGVGVVFATGTPISNSLTEMYTIQRYLGPSELERLNIKSFDAWLNSYGIESTDYELDGTGVKYKQTARLRDLTNMQALMPAYKQFTDSVTLNDIKELFRKKHGKEFPIPPITGGKRKNVVVPISGDQKAYFAELIKRAENIRPGDTDNMLAITTDARKASLDMRLIDPTLPDNPLGKTSAAADMVAENWKKWKKFRGTQIVFCDLSIPLHHAEKEGKRIRDLINKAEEGDEDAQKKVDELTPDEVDSVRSAMRGFSVYDDFKDKLIERGVDPREIAFIHDYNTDAQKADLYQQMNEGAVRVLMGSTPKLGTGTNVQKRIIGIAHLDCPWKPAQIEQREGRGIRTGNLLMEEVPDFSVDLMAFSTEQTYDARMWQVQEQKLLGIEGIRKYAGENEMEEVAAAAATAAEMKAAASGNPLILEDVQLKSAISKLKAQKKRHEQNEYDLRDKFKRYKKDITELPVKIPKQQADADLAKKYVDDPFAGNPPVGTVDGVEARSAKEAAALAWESVRRQKAEQGVTPESEKAEELAAISAREDIRRKNITAFAKSLDQDITPTEAQIFSGAWQAGMFTPASDRLIELEKAGVTKDAYAAWQRKHGEKYRAPKKEVTYSVDINGTKITDEVDIGDAIRKTWGSMDPFVMTIGGKRYISGREAASAILNKAVAHFELTATTKVLELGEMGGFKVSIDNDAEHRSMYDRPIWIGLTNPATNNTYWAQEGFDVEHKPETGLKIISAAEGIIKSQIRYELLSSEANLQRAKKELPAIEPLVGKPWDKGEELDRLEKRQHEVQRLLAGEKDKTPEEPDAEMQPGGAVFEQTRSELEAATGETYSDEAVEEHVSAAGGWGAVAESEKETPTAEELTLPVAKKAITEEPFNATLMSLRKKYFRLNSLGGQGPGRFEWVEKARQVELPGIKGEFFAYRKGKGKDYVIVEATSGLSIIDDAPTIAKGIQSAVAKIANIGGQEKLDAAIAKGIEKYGKSPRYPAMVPQEVGDEVGALQMQIIPGASQLIHEVGAGLTLFSNNVAKPLIELYKKKPEFTESKRIIGKYLGDRQKSDFELTQAARELNKRFPELTQRAMARYMEADGDAITLRAWADQTTDPGLKAVYEQALRLSDEEKDVAMAGARQFEQGLMVAIQHGILEQGIDHYFPHMGWERPTQQMKNIYSLINAGELQKDPKFAKRRIFDSFFEGEQFGLRSKAKTDTYGYGLIAWFRSLNEAIATRQMLKDLMKSKEKDGRPTVAITGAGSAIPREEEVKEVYLVRPNVKPEEAADYRFLDHPGLRKWKWATKDASGTPIFVQGSMVVHPDAYGRLNAVLGRSKITSWRFREDVPIVGGWSPGRAALTAGGFIKGTIMIGPFHQFHVGEHALFHKVNPFNPPKIDFNTRPILKELVDHGLMIHNHHALQEFSEGLATGGLWHRIPGLGGVLRGYQEFLFQDYIPRLKAAMAEHAVTRAEKWYAGQLADGRLTQDQLLENVAKQANAAFGEQNYKYMGRNPTLQSAIRLLTLAPDFLESRLKFGAQAVRPLGKEQFLALLRAAIGMAVAAQVVNLIFGDDHKVHLEKPFSVIIDGTEYTPRSVIGDLWHLFADPRSFVYHRLNPLYTKPLIEMATGRDIYGQKQRFLESVANIVKSWAPIPSQGFIRKTEDETHIHAIVNSILASIGISPYPHRSAAIKEMLDIVHDADIRYPKSETSMATGEFADKIKNGETITDEDIKRLADLKLIDAEGNMTPRFETSLKQHLNYTWEQRLFRTLKLDDALRVYQKMTDEEQQAFYPLLQTKVLNSEDFKQYQNQEASGSQ